MDEFECMEKHTDETNSRNVEVFGKVNSYMEKQTSEEMRPLLTLLNYYFPPLGGKNECMGKKTWSPLFASVKNHVCIVLVM